MRKHRHNLFLLITDFTHGGSERQFVELVSRLNPSRFRVSVGCLARRGEFAEDLAPNAGKIFEFRFPSLASVQALWQGLRLARLLRSHRIDLVHAFDFYTNMFALLPARLAGVPAVVASRRDTGAVWSGTRRFVLRQSLRAAHVIVANSEAARQSLEEEGIPARRIRLIRNGVDLNRFSPNGDQRRVRRRLGLPEDALLVATVATIRPEKDHETLLAAASEVIRRVPSARFLIVGKDPKGAAERWLRARTAALGLTDHVAFLGDRTDVPELLQAVDVFALSSLTESMPNAVLEAMGAGKPVVATAVGGVPELVDSGRTGLLVPPRQSAALADRIALLLEQPSLRAEMGARARARVEGEFDIAQAVHRFEGLYQELLEPGGKP